MMKKLICMILALGLLLAGCGGGSGGGNGITSVVNPDFQLSNGFIEPVDQVKSTPEGFIPITTAEEFDKIRLNGAANYILMNDIDLSGIDWEHISAFSGILDGNGYTVSGASEELIWSLEGGTVRNLGVYGDLINAAAGIVCQAIDGSTVFNCWFDGSIHSEATIEAVLTVMSVGGISVYAKESSFISCYNAAEITASMNQCGGVVSEIYENTTVKNCFNTGNISLTGTLYRDMAAGGVVGLMSINTGDGSQCQVVNCYNTGNITGKSAAGIVGFVEITEMYVTLNIDRCFNMGNITGSENAGGITNLLLLEEGSLVVTNCYNACTDAVEAGIIGGPGCFSGHGICPLRTL